MSWQAAFRWHDPYHHTKLLVSLYVALKKGWLHNVEDVWSAADSKADAAESSKSSGSADVVKRGVRPLAAVTATQKGKFVNTFTAVVKRMANPDLLRGARMLGLLTAGEEKAHARMAHEMRGAAQTSLFYAEWAQWSWLGPLRETLGVLSDPQKLHRMGFTVTFSGPLANPALADASVGVEDVQAGLCLQFVAELLRARCSLLWHTSSYPGLLAPLIVDNVDVVAEHMALLKRHAVAYTSACSQTRAVVARMVERSCFRLEIYACRPALLPTKATGRCHLACESSSLWSSPACSKPR
jgi:hypothetical protein